MATRRVKTKNRSQAYTGPSYRLPPWMKKKRGGKRRGGGRGGKRDGKRDGGRDYEKKKKVPDAPAYLLEEKKGQKGNNSKDIDYADIGNNKVGVVDVTVKLPSQFKKSEIFILEMSKSNIAIISKLVSQLQKLLQDEGEEITINKNDNATVPQPPALTSTTITEAIPTPTANTTTAKNNVNKNTPVVVATKTKTVE